MSVKAKPIEAQISVIHIVFFTNFIGHLVNRPFCPTKLVQNLALSFLALGKSLNGLRHVGCVCVCGVLPKKRVDRILEACWVEGCAESLPRRNGTRV